MRNLLAVIGLAVVVLGGGGWYLGWYKFSVAKSTDGTLEVNTVVDTKKAGSDSSEFLKNVSSAIGSHVDKTAQDAKAAAPDTAPGGTPGPVTPPQNGTINPTFPTIPVVPPAPVVPPVQPAPTAPPAHGGIHLFMPKPR